MNSDPAALTSLLRQLLRVTERTLILATALVKILLLLLCGTVMDSDSDTTYCASYASTVDLLQFY